MLQRSNKELLESSLERLARILADRHDIKVVFSGDRCCTEGRTIILPVIPDDCPDELYEAIQGYLDHESAHIIMDDWSVTGKINEPFTSLWLNAMNDLRDEHQFSKIWPGSKNNFQKASEYAFRKKIIQKWESSSPLTKLLRSTLYYGTKDMYFFDEIPDGQEWLEKIDPLKPALDLASDQPDTLHSLALACWIIRQLGREPCLEELPNPLRAMLEEIMEHLESDIEEQASSGGGMSLPMPSPSGGEEGGEEQDSEDGSTASGGSSGEENKETEEDDEEDDKKGIGSSGEEDDDDETEEETGKEEDEAKKEDDEEEEESSKPTGELKSLKEEFDVDDKDIEEATKSLKESMGSAIRDGVATYKHYQRRPKHKFYAPYTTVHDVIAVAPDGDKALFNKDRQDIRKSSGVMIRRLHSSLISREKSVMQYDKEWGRLNPRAFPRFLNTGYGRVFKQLSVGEVLNCRMLLLVDQSGSMSAFRKDVEARRAAVLFGEFCSQKKIPFEILSFTTVSFSSPQQRYRKAPKEDQDRYTRWGDLKITIYKEFYEDWRKVGHRLSHLEGSCHNYDGEAVKFATRRLLLAKKGNERLILFVFSDGMPEQAIDRYQPNHQWYLEQMVEEATLRGVECVGVGICTDSVKKYYPNWIVINDPTALASIQLDKLKEVLSFMSKTTRRKKVVG